MSVRGSVRTAAAALTITVGGLAVVPAFAATEVAHGQASAVNIAIAGMGQSVSGTYAASNDGTTQTTSGTRNPAITVLGSQSLISQGTLAQDATTSIAGKVVSSAACAGVSGDGATLANVGSSDSCFKTTDTLNLSSGALDAFKNFNPLTDIVSNGQLTPAFIAAFPVALQDAIKAGSAQIASAITAALQQAITALGSPSLVLDATAIEGRCTATDTSAAGSATLADAGLALDFGSNAPIDPIKIDLPVNPAPNTKLVTNLDAVTKAITDSLTSSLGGQTGPLAAILGPLGVALGQLSNALNPIIDQISSQLGPIEDNLLDVTLNKQSSTGANQIHVTALDAQVLPAAAAATGGSSLASIQLGDVDCLGGTATPAVNTPGTPTKPRPASNVPTDIDSGLAGDSGGLPGGVLATFGALLLAAAGGVGVRRVRLHHGKG